MIEVPQATLKRAARRKRIFLAFVFASVVTIAGLSLWLNFQEETAGNILLLPGVLAESVHMNIYCAYHPCPIIDDAWATFLIPGGSWIFYFLAFYLVAHWRARRKAARESVAPQGTSPNVA